MELIVDLHVHSHFSRATSRNCTLEGLYTWGKLKGITIIGTGDFTHPEWLAECRDKLEPTVGGLLQLKPALARALGESLPKSVQANLIYFVPSVEIATVYKKGGRLRKLHQLIVLPNFDAVDRLNARLTHFGNLSADGRPVLKLDSKGLLRLTLEADQDALYIPAHIWTPWFGLFGSKSGFDTLREAYEDLTPEIRAIETGLSSDPAMNWRLKQLDGLAITSNSDAHSPRKLGREATVLHAEPTYENVIGAIKTNDQRLAGTIEFFPEEGKYFNDGHRACGVKYTPGETMAHDCICPICGKPLVVGVNYRVGELADRTFAGGPPKKRVEYIVPLTELLAEIRGTKSDNGRLILAEYDSLISLLGDEFTILRNIPLAAIHRVAPSIAFAVGRIRAGSVYRVTGYDGVYGTIRVFKDADERTEVLRHLSQPE